MTEMFTIISKFAERQQLENRTLLDGGEQSVSVTRIRVYVIIHAANQSKLDALKEQLDAQVNEIATLTSYIRDHPPASYPDTQSVLVKKLSTDAEK